MTVFHRAPRSVMPQKYFQSLAGFYRLGCASVGAKIKSRESNGTGSSSHMTQGEFSPVGAGDTPLKLFRPHAVGC